MFITYNGEVPYLWLVFRIFYVLAEIPWNISQKYQDLLSGDFVTLELF